MDFPGYDNPGALANWIVMILATYAGTAGRDVIKRLGERAADGITDGVCRKATAVWEWLKGRFAKDQVRTKQLEAFEQSPAARRDDLAAILKQQLEFDEDFLPQIRPLLEELSVLEPKIPPEHRTQINIAIGNNITQIQGDGNTL